MDSRARWAVPDESRPQEFSGTGGPPQAVQHAPEVSPVDHVQSHLAVHSLSLSFARKWIYYEIKTRPGNRQKIDVPIKIKLKSIGNWLKIGWSAENRLRIDSPSQFSADFRTASQL